MLIYLAIELNIRRFRPWSFARFENSFAACFMISVFVWGLGQSQARMLEPVYEKMDGSALCLVLSFGWCMAYEDGTSSAEVGTMGGSQMLLQKLWKNNLNSTHNACILPSTGAWAAVCISQSSWPSRLHIGSQFLLLPETFCLIRNIKMENF